jgi:hypothetical protein
VDGLVLISALFWWGVSGVRSVSGREGVLSVEAAVLISALFWFSVSGVRSVSGREGVLSVKGGSGVGWSGVGGGEQEVRRR